MRRDLLSKTALLGNYVASDINLIGELTLYEKYKELQEHPFNRRMHPECSSWDRNDVEKQKEFWDPSKKTMGRNSIRQHYEYYKAALRAPVQRLSGHTVCVLMAHLGRVTNIVTTSCGGNTKA